MKSWKTTLCGLVAAIGAFLVTQTDPTWLPTVGKILVGVGTAGIGLFARDNSVTSKDAGAIDDSKK